MPTADKPTTIDQYLAALPADQSDALAALRNSILALVPSATESISYGMPTFKYRGKRLIYFAAAKHHCAIYGTSAGTIRFPADRPLTDAYLSPLLEARVREIDAKAPQTASQASSPRASREVSGGDSE